MMDSHQPPTKVGGYEHIDCQWLNTRSKVLHQWNWLEGDEGSAPSGALSNWLVWVIHGRLLMWAVYPRIRAVPRSLNSFSQGSRKNVAWVPLELVWVSTLERKWKSKQIHRHYMPSNSSNWYVSITCFMALVFEIPTLPSFSAHVCQSLAADFLSSPVQSWLLR